MNKKLLSTMMLCTAMSLVMSCAPRERAVQVIDVSGSQNKVAQTTTHKPQSPQKVKKTIKNNKNKPGSYAYYRDWDAAIRADVDMHNMYESTPIIIEKPIDMYTALALAIKYNYSRRLASYQQSLMDAGYTPYSKFPDILSKAGYINTSNSGALNPDLKVAWNALDMSSVYLLSGDKRYQAEVAYQENRKVLHNILQEARSLYWRSLAAQRLLPIMDSMIENLTLEVDEMNSQAKDLANSGQSLTTEQLVNKRKYMEAIKNLSDIKRQMEDSSIALASFMGFHPNTVYHLVGSEYGNFSLPEIKQQLSDLEWYALTARPELKVFDINMKVSDLKLQVKELKAPLTQQYKNNASYYNDLWQKNAEEISMEVFEDARKASYDDLNTLRRERTTAIILSQLYVAWAQYMSAIEDYEIRQEIANTSEDIAEDTTISLGSYAEKSKLEAARAIGDEAKAFLSYADVQDALGNLYSSIGLDPLPGDFYKERLSIIALTLKDTYAKWQKGEFAPTYKPEQPIMPTKRPAINLSSPNLMPDIQVRSGERFSVTIPQSVFDRLNLQGRVTTSAALDDGSPLPNWINYDEESYTISGVGMPSDTGSQNIKIMVTDENGQVGYITFKINLNEYYQPSMKVRGLTPDSSAEVYKRCTGDGCSN